MSRADAVLHPAKLSELALELLAEAYKEVNGGVVRLPVTDGYTISRGMATRAGRMLVRVGFLRIVPGSQVWLPHVRGAGGRRNDPPGQSVEITEAGTAALRSRMGPDSFAQLTRIRDEARARVAAAAAEVAP